MEIKELSFLENLSGNDNKTSVMDSVIGGHDDDYSYIYDLLEDFFHPFFEKETEVAEAEPEMVADIDTLSVASSFIGVPESPFESSI